MEKNKLNIQNIELNYLPGCKFDTVEEFSDGTMEVHTFEKKYYLYTHQNDQKIYIYNTLNGNVYLYKNPSALPELLNCYASNEIKGMSGFAIVNDQYCFYHGDRRKLYFFDMEFKDAGQINTNFESDTMFLHQDKMYLYNRKKALLAEFTLQDGVLTPGKVTEIKGIGNKSFYLRDQELWVSDSEENLVLVYDKETMKIKFQIITPFFDPQAIVFYEDKPYVLYGGEVHETSYGQKCWQEQKPFFHQLKYALHEGEGYNYTLSNAFLVEFTYEEHLEKVDLKYPELKIKIALPVNNIRQQVVHVESAGLKGQIKDGFLEVNLKNLREDSIGFVGYRADVVLSSVKYTFDKDYNQSVFPVESYHVEIDEIDLDQPKLIDMAAVSGSGMLQNMLEIRNKVFDKLTYRFNNSARNYVELLEDGYGTCGDYATIILMLAMINKYPVRTCGGYKVPRFVNSQQDLRSCYYNHTWLEIYLPDTGWVPIESSSDDKAFNNRLCEGQFLGLDWSHIQTHNDKSVPNLISAHDGKEDVHPFDLFRNVTFMKIKGEISDLETLVFDAKG